MDQPTDEGYPHEDNHSDEDLSFQSGSEGNHRFSSPGQADQEHDILQHQSNVSNLPATPQHVLMIDSVGGALTTPFRPSHHHRHYRHPDDENPNGGGGDSASDSFYTPTGGDASTAGGDTPSFSTAGAPSDETSFVSTTVDTRSSLAEEEEESSLEGGEDSFLDQRGPSSFETSETIDLLRTGSAETREDDDKNQLPFLMQPETPRASNTAKRVYSRREDLIQESNEEVSEVESLPDDEMLDTIHRSNVEDRSTMLGALPATLFVESLDHNDQESPFHDKNAGDAARMIPPPEMCRLTEGLVSELDGDAVVVLSGAGNKTDVGELPSAATALSTNIAKNIKVSSNNGPDQPGFVSMADTGHSGPLDGNSSTDLAGLEVSNAHETPPKTPPETTEHEAHLIVNDDASVEVSLGVVSETSMDVITNPDSDSALADDNSKPLLASQDTVSIPTNSATETIPPSSVSGDVPAGGIDDFEQVLADAEHDFLAMLGMDASTRSMLESAVMESHSESEKGTTGSPVLPLHSLGGHQPSSPVLQPSGPRRENLADIAVDLGASLSASLGSLDASETSVEEDSASIQASGSQRSRQSPRNQSQSNQEGIEQSETEESTGSAASIRAILQKELHDLGLTPNSDLNSPDPKSMPVSLTDSERIVPSTSYQDTPTVNTPSLVARAEMNASPLFQPATDTSNTKHSPREPAASAHESRGEATSSLEIASPLGAVLETAATASPGEETLPQTTDLASIPTGRETEKTARSQYQCTEEAHDSSIDPKNSLNYNVKKQPTLLSDGTEHCADYADSKSGHEVDGKESAGGEFAEKRQAVLHDAPATEKSRSSDDPKPRESKDMTATDLRTQYGGLPSMGSPEDETLSTGLKPGDFARPSETCLENEEYQTGHKKTTVGTIVTGEVEELVITREMSPTEIECNAVVEIVGQTEWDDGRQRSSTFEPHIPEDPQEEEAGRLESSQNNDGSNDTARAGREDLGIHVKTFLDTETTGVTESKVQTPGNVGVLLSEEIKPHEVEKPSTDVSGIAPDRQTQPGPGTEKVDVVSVGVRGSSLDVNTDEETQSTGLVPEGRSIGETLASAKTSEECADPEQPNPKHEGDPKGLSISLVGTEDDEGKMKEVGVLGISPTVLESNTVVDVVSSEEMEEVQGVATLRPPPAERTEEPEKPAGTRDEPSNDYGATSGDGGPPVGEVNMVSDLKSAETEQDEGNHHSDTGAVYDTCPTPQDADSTKNIAKLSEKTGYVEPETDIRTLPETLTGTSEVEIKDAEVVTGGDDGKVRLTSAAQPSDAERNNPTGPNNLDDGIVSHLGSSEEESGETKCNHDRTKLSGGTEEHSTTRAPGLEEDYAARQKSRMESKPPLFPKKTKELYENPDSFVEFLSKKLVAQVSAKAGNAEGNEATSLHLRMSFDPEKSVFANFAGDWESSELSPPGSPPEPSFEQSDDDGSSSEGSQESSSDFHAHFVHSEAATWDLISEPNSGAASFGLNESTTRHPDYVMMPDDVRTPRSSETTIPPSIARVDSAPSDGGALSRQRSQRISFGDASLSSSQHKRLEPSDGPPSVTHRVSKKRPLSARASKQKNRVKWARRSRFPRLRTMNSLDMDDADETVSLGAKLLQDEIFRNVPGKQLSRGGLLLKTVSSPDLGSSRIAPALGLGHREGTDIFRSHRPPLRQSKSFEEPRAEEPRAEKPNRGVTSLERQSNDGHLQKRSPEHSPVNEGNLIHIGRIGYDSSSEQEESMLHEELLTFTTLEPIVFSFQFPVHDLPIRYCGSLCWLQLLSLWRHAQVFRSLTKEPSVLPLTRAEVDFYEEDDIESSHGRVKNESIDFLDLNGMKVSRDGALRDTLTGVNTTNEILAVSLLRSLSSRSPGNEENPLRHVVQSPDTTSVEAILLAAESNLGIFTDLIKSIVGFACHELVGELGSMIDYNVCTKTAEATLRKAGRKYGGDVLQVKDVLRGSIVFPSVGSLLCGLFFLAEICSDGDGWKAGGRHVRLEVVRVKNLFSSACAFSRSPLPTGYRHVLLNIRLDGGVLAEIQCHLSGMYDVLGDTGYVLHRDVNDLAEACGGKLRRSFETYDVLLKSIMDNHANLGSTRLLNVQSDASDVGPGKTGNETSATDEKPVSIYSPSVPSERDLGDTPGPVVGEPDVVASVGFPTLNNNSVQSLSMIPAQIDATPPRHQKEDNDNKTPRPEEVGSSGATISKDPVSPPERVQVDFDRNLSELETPIAGRSLRNPDPVDENLVIDPISLAIMSPITQGGLSGAAKSKLLEDLQSRDKVPSPETIMLAILEHATSAASGSPRDLASFFCLHALFISFLRDENVSWLMTDGKPIQAADLVEYSRRCLLRCFVLCCQATSIGMTGWLEYGENDPVVRLEEGPGNILNLIADSFAQELNWNEAQSVLQCLFLKYERELPSYHPVRIESIFNLASVATINENASFAAKLIYNASDAVSRRFAELEKSILSFIQNYSSSATQKNPSFRPEGLGSFLVALSRYVSNLQESIVVPMGSDHRYRSGVILVQQNLVADGFAVLANCKSAVRTKLGSWSSSDKTSGRYYWKMALTYYHKAFKGLSATNGFEDARVCGTAFGMARCLRELGEQAKALELLSTVVAALETTPGSPIRQKVTPQPLAFQPFGGEKKRDLFLSHVLHLQSGAHSSEPQIQHHVTVALCLWQMSVLSVDSSPDEKGRTRAFGLLHAASMSMQLALRELPDIDGMIRGTCIDILRKIESEAKKISKPLSRH